MALSLCEGTAPSPTPSHLEARNVSVYFGAQPWQVGNLVLLQRSRPRPPSTRRFSRAFDQVRPPPRRQGGASPASPSTPMRCCSGCSPMAPRRRLSSRCWRTSCRSTILRLYYNTTILLDYYTLYYVMLLCATLLISNSNHRWRPAFGSA